MRRVVPGAPSPMNTPPHSSAGGTVSVPGRPRVRVCCPGLQAFRVGSESHQTPPRLEIASVGAPPVLTMPPPAARPVSLLSVAPRQASPPPKELPERPTPVPPPPVAEEVRARRDRPSRPRAHVDCAGAAVQRAHGDERAFRCSSPNRWEAALTRRGDDLCVGRVRIGYSTRRASARMSKA